MRDIRDIIENFKFLKHLVFTIERIECFAVSNDRQRVVVIKLVVKLVWVRIVVSRLWRA